MTWPHSRKRTYAAQSQVPSEDLNDFQDAIIELNRRSVKSFGAVGDGVVDDTAAIQDAIAETAGEVLFFPKGKYRVTETLYITSRMHRICGELCGRNNTGGTEIAYSGTGPCIQIHTDNGQPWDANLYDGSQDQWFEDLWISAASPATALALDPTKFYKAGTYGIRDWRGGGIRLRNVGLEGFEYNFWGVQSDISDWMFVVSLYSKHGLYFGPRSDQITIHDLYSFYCDRAVIIDRARQVRILDGQFVGCGNSVDCPIEIRKGSGPTQITRCWFEHLGGIAAGNHPGFISAGIVDGYGPGGVGTTTSSATQICVEDPLIYTEQAGGSFHTRSIVQLGAANGVRISNPGAPVGSVPSNVAAYVLAPSGTAYTNAQASAMLTGISSGLADSKIFLNEGTGAPDICAIADGASGLKMFSTARPSLRRFGFAAGANEIEISTEGVAGSVFLITPNFASGQISRAKFQRAFHMSGTAAPTSGIWQQGDVVIGVGAGPGQIFGWYCTAGGTPGTWLPIGSVGPGSSNVKSTNYTVLATDSILIASGGAGNLVFTLPATPTPGQRLEVYNHNATFTLTLARNGQEINNVTSDVVIAAGAGAVLVFIFGDGWFAQGLVPS
jgi:hypothetical protein